jgi:hypothetical protein
LPIAIGVGSYSSVGLMWSTIIIGSCLIFFLIGMQYLEQVVPGRLREIVEEESSDDKNFYSINLPVIIGILFLPISLFSSLGVLMYSGCLWIFLYNCNKKG